MSFSRSAAATAAAAASRITVSIVPSTGPGDRAVRRRARQRERMGEVEAVEASLAGEALREPAHDLAEDHARVAPGAEEGAFAESLGDALHARLVPHVPEHLGAGREHVRAGVAVGNGEDVEGVDLVDVALEVCDRGSHGPQEAGAVAGDADHARRSPASGPTRPVAVVRGASSCTGLANGRRIDPRGSTLQASRALPAAYGCPPTPWTWIATGPTPRAQRSLESVADRGVDLAGDLCDRHAVGDRQPDLGRDHRMERTRGWRGCPRPSLARTCAHSVGSVSPVTP